MKKICFVVSTLAPSGPVNVLYNIIKYLDFSKIDASIITISEESIESRKNDFELLGVKVYCLNENKGLISLRLIWKFHKKIASLNAEVIHSHCFRSTLLLKFINKNILKIATVHNYPKYDYEMKYGKIKGGAMALIYNYVLKNIDYPIACADNIKYIYKQQLNLDLESIQNGVDLEIFTKEVVEKREIRKKLNLEENTVYFISVGSLCKRKNPIAIAEAIKKLGKKEVKLIYLGTGIYENELKKYGDNVIVIGKVDNVKEYLFAADYFVSSSLAEGLPNSVLEALAMGLPVTLSNIEPHMEILKEDEEIGVSFNPYNIDELGDKILEVLNKDYTYMSNKARKLLEEKFSAELMAQKYEKIYSR